MLKMIIIISLIINHGVFDRYKILASTEKNDDMLELEIKLAYLKIFRHPKREHNSFF